MPAIILQEQTIVNKIYYIRGQKVMLDEDLAEIFGVETRVLNQAVSRNSTRFPIDFIFQLTDNEYKNLKSQIVISSKSNYGGRRKLPYAFTEHGVVMLASILNSPIAIQASITVVRTFIKLRQLLSENQILSQKITDLERETKAKFTEQDTKIDAVFEAIQQLSDDKNEPRNPVGFKISNQN